jgi:hypothetical protein
MKFNGSMSNKTRRGYNHMKFTDKRQVKPEKVSRYKAFISSKNEYLNCVQESYSNKILLEKESPLDILGAILYLINRI